MMKGFYKLLGVAALTLSLFSVAWAQERSVSGKVTDETGAGMPGVNVLVKGTSTGTGTDAEGNYKINVPNDQAVLVFTFIGYVTAEVPVGARTVVDTQMAPDVTTLSELVVTGYTTENRRDISGAVATIKTKDLVAVPSGNIEQQFQGRVSGMTVITNGQPGTTSVVRVRGFGAFGGNEPLYVVDGVPIGGVLLLQPNDIESTTVLKDAASASIYGARAANGVIVITTKKGKKGDNKLNISYDGVYGVVTPGKVDNILNPQETADWTWQAVANTAYQLGTTPDYVKFKHPQYGTGTSPVLPDYLAVGTQSGVIGSVDLNAEKLNYNIDLSKGSIYQVIAANKAGTNWWGEITRPAPLNRHMLSFSGGNDKGHYYLSMGMQDQAGILIQQKFKRYSIRLNTEFELHKKLRIGENIQFTQYSTLGLMGGSGGRGAANDENDVLSAFRMPSIIPVYDAFGGYAGTAAKGFNNPRNPVAARNRSANNNNFTTLGFGNIYAELDIVKGLTFKSSIGGSISNNYGYGYSLPTYENSENNSSYTYSEYAGYNKSWVFTNTLQYSKKMENHSIDVLLGEEALNTGKGRNISGSGLNPFVYDPNYVTLTNTQGSGRVLNSGYNFGVNFYSLFGQVKYWYNDKYNITALIRRDGSSRFGANNRFGIFPALSAAWRVSSEGFMSNQSLITDLKVRGGWGEMGNSNNVDPYNQFTLFSASLGNSAYDISGSNSSVAEGFYRSRIGNPNAKWETSQTSNIGFDGTILNGKWDIVFDVWRKDTRDLLFTLETAAVTGPMANDPAVNVAKMRNEGIDIEITNRGDITSDLSYEVRGTASFLHNEIMALAPGITNFSSGGSRIGAPVRNEVGYPISSYFGYKVLGLFQTPEEVAAAPTQSGSGVGRFRYADINGDGVINSSDRTHLGDPVPNFSGGINARLTYKGFDLETFLGVYLGFENYNFSKWFTDFYPSFTGAAIGTNVKDSFIPGKGGNTVPIFEDVSNFSTNTQHNSYYMEKGSYARLHNLSLGYTLPTNVIVKYGFNRARLFIQATNLFTISKYSGLDPGVGGQADTTLGIDVGNPPVTKGFNLGVSLGF